MKTILEIQKELGLSDDEMTRQMVANNMANDEIEAHFMLRLERGETTGDVIRSKQTSKERILSVSLKHLPGQHNQKRHGWRYSRGGTYEQKLGSARRSMQKTPEYGERDVYRKRAGMPGLSELGATKKPYIAPVPKPAPKPAKPPKEKPADQLKAMGVKPTAAFKKRVVEKHNSALESKYMSGAETLKEKQGLLEKQLKTAIGDHPIAMRAKAEAAQSIIADGRFKTGFETGSGHVGGFGSTTMKNHAATQNDAFGYSKNYNQGDMSKRPVYGIVLGATGKTGEASNYGEVTFVLKSAVKARTTVTVEDSYYNQRSGDVLPSPMLSPKYYSVPTSSPNKSKYTVGSDGLNLYSGARYVEAQVHGGISLSDVAKVLINPYMPAYQANAIKQQLDAKGIPYEDSYD